jgi:cephalosporin-C deacetylase-like acetyl esterase
VSGRRTVYYETLIASLFCVESSYIEEYLFGRYEGGELPLIAIARVLSRSVVLVRERPWRSGCFAIALMCIAACSPRSALVCQTASLDTTSHFAYDASTPLDLRQVSTEQRGGVTIQEITYTSPRGGVVPATLVFPRGNGKFAAVIWGHWLMPNATNSNRSEFLQEAIALAPTGVVSLLVEAPQARPGFKATPNPTLVAQQVVDLRRAVDLLLSRPDVDPKRIAYVGHSWDAGTGAILDALDKRFTAFVFMSGPQSTRQYVLSSDSPRMVSMRKSVDMAKVEQTLQTNAWADPASYAGQFGPAAALFQYGLHDEDWVPLQDAKDYFAMSSGPKEVKFYDSDHALTQGAERDRDEFLKKHLDLTP